MTKRNITAEKPLTYVFDKLYSSVLSLMKGSDSIQERLFNAFQSFSSLKLDDFPEDLQKDFEEIQKELMKIKALRDEGRVKAAQKGLSDEQANHLSERILNLFISITERYGRMFPLALFFRAMRELIIC
jgi:ATP phosphoribosyltransferase regulatory subunit HisZ